jgi:GNAT superfamily N-acetyltransferase
MSYRGSKFSERILKSTYFREHHDFAQAALGRSAVFCAVAKDDEEHIYGWACIEPPTGDELTRALHYVYVKHPYRNFGIAGALLDHVLENEDEFEYTHLAGGRLEHYLNDGGYYNPYRFFKIGGSE